jgi:hypothetical protein
MCWHAAYPFLVFAHTEVRSMPLLETITVVLLPSEAEKWSENERDHSLTAWPMRGWPKSNSRSTIEKWSKTNSIEHEGDLKEVTRSQNRWATKKEWQCTSQSSDLTGSPWTCVFRLSSFRPFSFVGSYIFSRIHASSFVSVRPRMEGSRSRPCSCASRMTWRATMTETSRMRSSSGYRQPSFSSLAETAVLRATAEA